MAEDHPARAGVAQHRRGDVAGVRALRVLVAVLPADRDPAAGQRLGHGGSAVNGGQTSSSAAPAGGARAQRLRRAPPPRRAARASSSSRRSAGASVSSVGKLPRGNPRSLALTLRISAASMAYRRCAGQPAPIARFGGPPMNPGPLAKPAGRPYRKARRIFPLLAGSAHACRLPPRPGNLACPAAVRAHGDRLRGLGRGRRGTPDRHLDLGRQGRRTHDRASAVQRGVRARPRGGRGTSAAGPERHRRAAPSGRASGT